MDTNISVPAIEELLGHADWARRLARDLTADEGRAEDAVQDAYVAALERPPDRSENLRGWFARVVANGIRMRGRTETRRVRRERASAREEALPSAAELAGEIEWQRRVAAAVLELDEPQRTTVLLHFYRQLPLAEIARRQGEPAATVRSRLKRALDQLRARFDREHGGDRRAWCALLSTWARRGAGAAAPTIPAASITLWLGIAVLAGGGTWTVWMATRAAAPGSERDALATLPPANSGESPRTEEPDDGHGEGPRSRLALDERRSRIAAGSSVAATGPMFSGTVADDAGSPIAGARITAHIEEKRPFSDAIGTADSDPDGRFSFASSATDLQGLTLVARARGFSTLVKAHMSPGREIALVLDPVAAVSGVVRDAETRAPLAGVTLSSGLERTATDARGTYRLEGLPQSSNGSIRAHVTGYAVEQREVVLERNEHPTLDFDLVRGVQVDVEVLEPESGTPIADVAVRDSGDDVPWTRTNAKGRFILSIAPEHPVELELVREGFLQTTWSWTPVAVESGKSVRVPMARMVSIEGKVVDDHGDAIPDAHLSAQPQRSAFRRLPTAEIVKRWATPGSLSYMSLYLEEGVRSRADGRYVLPIRSGMPTFTVHAGRPGYVSAKHGPIDASSPSHETTVDFVLPRAARVHGQALRDGKPWQGRVVFQDATGQEAGGAWVTGEYRLDDVPAGTWTIALEHRTRKTKEPALPSFSVRVEAGGTYEHDFVWGDDQPKGTISGRVVAAGGILPEKLYATARPVEEPEQAGDSTEVGADGAFTLHVPAGKPYLVSAWAQGAAERAHTDETKVVPDVDGIELRMPELGRLRLCLVDSRTREPVQPRSHFLASALTWRVAGSSTEGGRENIQIDRNGCFEFELRVGDYDIRLDLGEEGYRPLACDAIPVRAGEPTVRTIELVRGIEVRVRIAGPSGNEVLPLAGHLLFLVERGQIDSISGPYPKGDPQGHHSFGGINGLRMRIDDPSLMQQFLYSDDVFRDGMVLKALAPGRYSVRCFPEDYDFEPAELDVRGPERTTLEFRWRRR